jgi:hypothetical protein
MEPSSKQWRELVEGGLVASAKMLENGNALYSEEGTSIQNQELSIEEIKAQLRNHDLGATRINQFVNDLRLHRFAAIREPMSSWH